MYRRNKFFVCQTQGFKKERTLIPLITKVCVSTRWTGHLRPNTSFCTLVVCSGAGKEVAESDHFFKKKIENFWRNNELSSQLFKKVSIFGKVLWDIFWPANSTASPRYKKLESVKNDHKGWLSGLSGAPERTRKDQKGHVNRVWPIDVRNEVHRKMRNFKLYLWFLYHPLPKSRPL